MKNFVRLAASLGLAVLCAICAKGVTPAAQAYSKFGVIDTKGREIIPCNYAFLQYLGSGLYLAEEPDDLNPDDHSHKVKLFDSDGVEITVPVPAGYSLADVYLPNIHKAPDDDPRLLGLAGDAPNTTSAERLKLLPKSSYLKIYGREGYGVCDTNGVIILEPKYKCIRFSQNKVLVFQDDRLWSDLLIEFNPESGEIIKVPPDNRARMRSWGEYWRRNAVTLNRDEHQEDTNSSCYGLKVVSHSMPNGEIKNSVVDRNGKTLIPPSNSRYYVISKKRVITKISDMKFSPRAWRDRRYAEDQRYDLLRRLLYQYDLIGMDRVELEKLLGVSTENRSLILGDESRYWLAGGGCINVPRWELVIEFLDGKVRRWREGLRDQTYKIGKWYETNVVAIGNVDSQPSFEFLNCREKTTEDRKHR